FGPAEARDVLLPKGSREQMIALGEARKLPYDRHGLVRERDEVSGVRLEPFGWHHPKLFMQVQLAPLTSGHFSLACTCEQQESVQRPEWIANYLGGMPNSPQLVVVENALARLLGAYQC